MKRTSQGYTQRPVAPYSTAHLHSQLRATRALLKFCEEHKYKSKYLDDIKACASALKSEAIREAVMHYKAVPLGGNNCFNDWCPPVIYPHETEEYVWIEFEALVEFWARLMALSGG